MSQPWPLLWACRRRFVHDGTVAQLADHLLANGLVTATDIDAASQSSATGRALGQVLVDRGVVAESTLVKFVAGQLGMPFFELADLTIDGSALALVPAPCAGATG